MPWTGALLGVPKVPTPWHCGQGPSSSSALCDGAQWLGWLVNHIWGRTRTEQSVGRGIGDSCGQGQGLAWDNPWVAASQQGASGLGPVTSQEEQFPVVSTVVFLEGVSRRWPSSQDPCGTAFCGVSAALSVHTSLRWVLAVWVGQRIGVFGCSDRQLQKKTGSAAGWPQGGAPRQPQPRPQGLTSGHM